MNNVTLPANAMILFENFINVVTFDVMNFKEDLGLKMMNTSSTMPFNDNFETLGYDSQISTYLLGSINLMIIWVLIRIGLHLLMIACNCNSRKQTIYSDPFYIARLAFGLMLQTLLEILICSLATLLPNE